MLVRAPGIASRLSGVAVCEGGRKGDSQEQHEVDYAVCSNKEGANMTRVGGRQAYEI